jgi:hypothetical protein
MCHSSTSATPKQHFPSGHSGYDKLHKLKPLIEIIAEYFFWFTIEPVA